MGKGLSAVAAMALLTGCSAPVETRVLSSGTGLGEAPALLAEEGVAPPLAAKARAMVVAELENHLGLSAKPATHRLTVTVSERPAALSLVAGDKASTRTIAGAKARKPLQNCADREYRLTVLLTRIADGSDSYRGEAASYQCKATIEERLPYLVTAAIADLRAPKGRYSIRQAGRE